MLTSKKPRRRSFRPQFTLRSLMVAVVLACLPLSWFAVRLHQAREQQRTVDAIRKGGGIVYYGDQCDEANDPTDPADWPATSLAEKVFGEGVFRSVVAVKCGRDARIDDDTLTGLRQLGTVRNLCIANTKVSDSAINRLDLPSSVTKLRLGTHDVSVADLGSILALPNLRALHVSGDSLSPNALSRLESAAELRYLCLNVGTLTEQDMQALGKGRQVEVLVLVPRHMRADTLRHLEALTSLRQLVLGTPPSIDRQYELMESAEAIAEKLPNTRVFFGGRPIGNGKPIREWIMDVEFLSDARTPINAPDEW